MTAFRFRPVPASEAGFSAETLQELRTYFDALVADGEYPGAVTLLARGDRLAMGQVAGYDDVETGALLRPDSIFTLYSMSKPLTAAGMMLLHEEGKWDLDDPVSRHLLELKDIARLPGSKASREPTIRELFTHTAGFSFGKTPEEMMEFVTATDWSNARSLTELIGRYARRPLGYEPGQDWEYSVATDLQAEIVERVTGERFDLFLKRRLFEPLGMKDTAFALSHEQTGRLVQAHVLDAETGRLRGATMAERRESIFPMGGTSFKSTAMDYARFGRMLLNRGILGETRVLKPESVDLMLSNLLSEEFLKTRRGILQYVVGDGNGYAMNGLVCINPERAGRLVGRGTYEWGGAFSTFFWIDPENDLLFVGMMNRQRTTTEMRPPEVIAQELVYRALKG
ncbi:MAG TPA: serine hydrolase domain-containing protein [Caulobacteraceae bacterium]|nr:serine hydrolase domain-containing protein [Caulobacteraceae bacterium]